MRAANIVSICVVLIPVLVVYLWTTSSPTTTVLLQVVHSFVLPPATFVTLASRSKAALESQQQQLLLQQQLLWATRESKDTDILSDINNNNNNNNNNKKKDFDYSDDESLLEFVPIAQFIDLCLHLNLPAEGTKEDMLLRLRNHAEEQASLDRRRKLERAERVRQGSYGDAYKERYELIGGDNDDDGDGDDTNTGADEEDKKDDDFIENLATDTDTDAHTIDDEGYFYFVAPTRTSETTTDTTTTTTTTTTTSNSSNNNNNNNNSTELKSKSKSKTNTKSVASTRRQQRVITAPPPPKIPNEQGERVVTVYSTSDTNDLTANARPGMDGGSGGGGGSSSNGGVLMEGQGSSVQPWDLGGAAAAQVPKLSIELEEAKETVLELVRSLLLLSGAPSFVQEFTEGLEPLDNTRLPSSPLPSRDFVGFDPSSVPTDMLVASSSALRAGRGSVLQQVLYDLELRAVGYDGMAGDDKSKGGGHYEQVNKVRAFLEGFRRAELRRIARETTTLLLDKLASEGIQGLDNMLATMTKSQDDSGDAGQLSDALVEFLNDMVREQSMRVGDVSRVDRTIPERDDEVSDDALSKLWNVTSENGERIETLDPNDPVVKEAMANEWDRDKDAVRGRPQQQLPTAAPEQLLLLLKTLRDRIKAEAAFGSDNDRGRNLRILAYCLRFERALDREKLLRREFQSSVDRLDTFVELVISSIEYAESASTQLKPASASGMLNPQLLKEIMTLARKIREEMATSRT